MSEYGLPDSIERRDVSYDEYRNSAKDGDLVLYTPETYFARAIARHTGGPGWNFCHIEAVLYWETVGRLMSVGYQEKMGGIARPLSVRYSCGHTHVFRVPKLGDNIYHDGLVTDRLEILQHLGADLGRGYKWGNIWFQFLNLLPLARLLIPQNTFKKWIAKASASQGMAICSQHIHRSFALGGIDFTRKDSALVTPNDIAQSPLCEYVCSLK